MNEAPDLRVIQGGRAEVDEHRWDHLAPGCGCCPTLDESNLHHAGMLQCWAEVKHGPRKGERCRNYIRGYVLLAQYGFVPGMTCMSHGDIRFEE